MTVEAPLRAARIVCLDLDTFFVSVERLLDPSLVGKPVVVGGSWKRGQRERPRGVVTACSYEVREFGVRSGMPLATATRLAPHAIFLSGRHGTYGGYAKRVRAVIEARCPRTQVASIDEFYLDFRGCERLFARPGDADGDATIERTVRAITAAIRDEIGLPSSAGIASSKPIAKIASGMAKPAGVLLVPAGKEREMLAPLPVGKYPGIGPVAQKKLEALGIRTLGHLAALEPDDVKQVLGSRASMFLRGARGNTESDDDEPEDGDEQPSRADGDHLGRDRPAFREHDPRGSTVGSISNERTFFAALEDEDSVLQMLSSLAERVCWRARKRGVVARTVTLKLRYTDFQTLSRSRTIPATCSEREVLPVLRELYTAARTRSLGIRLLGVAVSKLELADASQLELFHRGDPELLGSLDDIRERFGFEAVRFAGSRAPRRVEGRRDGVFDGDEEPAQTPRGDAQIVLDDEWRERGLEPTESSVITDE
ncbi:MAG: DNA polymerase IV [Myxococcales bacterium]|nr:DNA polymerase IV [Myxococcales bacterium]